MSLVNFLKRIFRFLLRTYEWARGWRHRPLSSTPPQQLFTMIANRARGLRGAYFRAIYFFAGAVGMCPERLFLHRVNSPATLPPPVNAVTLRRAAQWQQAILEMRPMVPKPHLNIRVHDAEHVQLDRLVSVLLVSNALGSISFFFDDPAALAARLSSSTLREEGRGGTAFDLNSEGVVDVRAFSDTHLSRIFSAHTGFDGNVNSYLKVAHPGALVVALSLSESDEGLCDDSLAAWLSALETFESPIENVSFVILNAVGPDALGPALARSAVSFARMAGLSFAETLRLAQQADVFMGRLDAFGVAALAAQRPGIYIGEATGLPTSSTRQIFATDTSPAQACDRLRAGLVDASKKPRKSMGIFPTGVATGRSAVRQGRDTPVFPTYVRPQLLARLLQYLERERAPFPILVLDSSGPDALGRNKESITSAHLNIRHTTYDQSMDPYAKIGEGLSAVATAYCSICADDDVLIVPAVEKSVTELERRPDFGVAHGYYFNFIEQETFDLSYVMYRGKSIEDAHALARLRTLFSAYEAVFYGVFRTELMRGAFRDVDKVNTVLGKELLTASLSIIAGKSLRIPCFYYGRNTAESLPYSAWHPHQILAYKPELLFSEFPVFRSLLVQAVQSAEPDLRDENAGKTIDLIFLRYLEAFLRHDVLDLMLDLSMRGQESAIIYPSVWDVFVRSGRPSRPIEPLLDTRGRFNPQHFGAGRSRDYGSTGIASGGKERRYRIFHEFLFPQTQPTPFAGPEMLTSLLRTLSDY